MKFRPWWLGVCIVVYSLCYAPNVAAYALKHTSGGKVVRWQEGKTNVELRRSPELDELVAAGDAEVAASMAADAWRGIGAAPQIVIGLESAPPYDPLRRQGGIYVLVPWPYEKDRVAVTVTSYYPTGQLVGLDILINGEVDFALLPELPSEEMPSYLRHKHDLAAVLTHEYGHVLGLDESEDDPTATMWPYIRAGETHQRTLSRDDEDGLVDLYAMHSTSQVSTPATCHVSRIAAYAAIAADGRWWLILAVLALLRTYRVGICVRSARDGALKR